LQLDSVLPYVAAGIIVYTVIKYTDTLWAWQRFKEKQEHSVACEYNLSLLTKLVFVICSLYLAIRGGYTVLGFILLFTVLLVNPTIAYVLFLINWVLFFYLYSEVFSRIRPLKFVLRSDGTLVIYSLFKKIEVKPDKIKSAKKVRPPRLKSLRDNGSLYEITVEIENKVGRFYLQNIFQERKAREFVECLATTIE